jgi:hypothetical protein
MPSSIAIRPVVAADLAAVARLAELDSRTAPEGALLIAEVDGDPVAVMALAGGDVVANPFRPTNAVVEMLRLRARQLAPRRQRRPRQGMKIRTGLLPGLRAALLPGHAGKPR